MKLFDHPRYDPPFKRGDKYFYIHNTGLQAQSILYVQNSLDGEPKVLFDPSSRSADGTVSLSTLSVSQDAKFMAYGLGSSGSDWMKIKVMRVEDKGVEFDTLSWVKFSGVHWTHDGKGFFYSRYPAPKEGENIDASTHDFHSVTAFRFYDRSSPIYTQPQYFPPSKMLDVDVTDSVIGEGCVIKNCKIHHSVVGLRSCISEGAIIENTLLMGADYYEVYLMMKITTSSQWHA